MKRDMDLIRQILLEVEARQDFDPFRLEIDDRPLEEVAYHVMLLYQAGLIHAVDFSSNQQLDWWPWYLTWEGQDFLEAARDDSRWKMAKKTVLEKAGGLAFDVLKTLLFEMAKRSVLSTPSS